MRRERLNPDHRAQHLKTALRHVELLSRRVIDLFELSKLDAGRVERVLQNLIDNALRHTPAGGEVSLALDARGTLIEVSVSDTGSGIAIEHLPHVFERYWRAGDATTVEAAPGSGASSGLGLAIVKRILDLHSSVAHVQSALSQGTEVRFGLMRVG